MRYIFGTKTIYGLIRRQGRYPTMILNRLKSLTISRVSSLLLLSLILTSGLAAADNISLREGHPEKYTVSRGDTLWDISAKFLQDPWLWPEIWDINPKINNPHLIYPGDVVMLTYINGKPQLLIERPASRQQAASAQSNVLTNNNANITSEPSELKLSPRIRRTNLHRAEAINTIPADTLRKFLEFPRVVDKQTLSNAGYILADKDNSLLSGTGDKIYARGMDKGSSTLVDIMRQGKIYKDPDNNRILGYEAIHLGHARIIKDSDPLTLIITDAKKEVMPGDRLMITETTPFPEHFLPRAPDDKQQGQIIAMLNGDVLAGQYQIVVLNIGTKQGIDTGHVLAIYQPGNQLIDHRSSNWNKRIKLPDERVGTIMVIRPFEKISYALIMSATRDLRVKDLATNP